MNNPKEIIEANMKGAVTKATLPLGRMIVLDGRYVYCTRRCDQQYSRS